MEQVQVQQPRPMNEIINEPLPVAPLPAPVEPVVAGPVTEPVAPVVTAKPSKTGLFLAAGIIGAIILAAIILIFLTKPEAPPPAPKKTPAVVPQVQKPKPTPAPSLLPTPATVPTTANIEKELNGLSVEDASTDITDLNADLQGL